jgi:Region found in RelA / SpoT proteins
VIPQRLVKKIANAAPFFDALKKNVAETLAAFADEKNYPFFGRIKTAESVSEKIEMGRYARFSEIDDLVAFTLIVPTPSQIPEVVDFCRRSFDVVIVRSKTNTQKPSDVFRFDSTRIIARVKRPPDFVGAPGRRAKTPFRDASERTCRLPGRIWHHRRAFRVTNADANGQDARHPHRSRGQTVLDSCHQLHDSR